MTASVPELVMRTRARPKRAQSRDAKRDSWGVVAPRERPVWVRTEEMVEWMRGWL